jgi:hypothetical protein
VVCVEHIATGHDEPRCSAPAAWESRQRPTLPTSGRDAFGADAAGSRGHGYHHSASIRSMNDQRRQARGDQSAGLKPAGLKPGGLKPAAVAVAMAISLLITTTAALPGRSQGVERARSLPDLSGLAWVEGDLFIGVHDAKPSGGQPELPRISLVQLPRSKREGVSWKPLAISAPMSGGPINDLESVSRLPGGQGFLLAESGQGGMKAQRLFLASYRDGRLSLDAQVPWPVPVENVEASEVVQVGQQLLFLYAERADGRAETLLRWAPISLNPLQFGAFQEAIYRGVDPVGHGARPIVALAADADGYLYSASSYDSGHDGGPFRSVVWRIGRISPGEDGQPQVDFSAASRLATLDGLKVESLAMRDTSQDGKQLFIGTDDEDYGGILRLLPVRLPADRPRAAR